MKENDYIIVFFIFMLFVETGLIAICIYLIALLTCRVSFSATFLLSYFHGDLHSQLYRSQSCSMLQDLCSGIS